MSCNQGSILIKFNNKFELKHKILKIRLLSKVKDSIIFTKLNHIIQEVDRCVR